MPQRKANVVDSTYQIRWKKLWKTDFVADGEFRQVAERRRKRLLVMRQGGGDHCSFLAQNGAKSHRINTETLEKCGAGSRKRSIKDVITKLARRRHFRENLRLTGKWDVEDFD